MKATDVPTPIPIPTIPVDAEIMVGQTVMGDIQKYRAYIVRLTVNEMGNVVLDSMGMKIWVDIESEITHARERYLADEEGKLYVSVTLVPGTYLLTFAAINPSDVGSFVLSVYKETVTPAPVIVKATPAPTKKPTEAPTAAPTKAPTVVPAEAPTEATAEEPASVETETEQNNNEETASETENDEEAAAENTADETVVTNDEDSKPSININEENNPAAEESAAALETEAENTTIPGEQTEVQPKDAASEAVPADVSLNENTADQTAEKPTSENEKADVEENEEENADAVEPEAEKADAEKTEAEKADAEETKAEKADAVEPEAEKADAEETEEEKADAEETKAEKADAEETEAEKADGEEAEEEKADAVEPEAEKADTEETEAEKADAEETKAEKADAVEPEAEKADTEETEAEKADAEETEAEKADAVEPEAEKADAEETEAEKADAEETKAEKADAEETEAEKADAVETEAEKADAEETEEEKADAEETEAEKADGEEAEEEKADGEEAEEEKADAEETEEEKADAEETEEEKTDAEETEEEKADGEETENAEEQAAEFLPLDEQQLVIGEVSNDEAEALYTLLFDAVPAGTDGRLMMKAAPQAAELLETEETESETEEAPESGSVSGFAVYEIAPIAELENANSYQASLRLPQPIDLLRDAPEGAELSSQDVKLYHIKNAEDGTLYAEEVQAIASVQDGVIDAIAFITDGFSRYVLTYSAEWTHHGAAENHEDEPKPEGQEPEETEAEDAAQEMTYTFAGIEDYQLVSYIMGVNGVYANIESVTVSDETAVEIDDDLYAVALTFFDEVIMTVVTDEEETYTFILKNPDPDAGETEPVALTAEDISAVPYDEEQSLALAEQYGLTVEAGENQEIGYAAFDISLLDPEKTSENGYIVPVSLDAPISLPTREDQPIERVDYALFHIVDGVAETVTLTDVAEDQDAYTLDGFTFQTPGFSDYVLRYTVDFVYVDEQGEEHAWSFPGQGAYTQDEILNAAQPAIEYTSIDYEKATLTLTEQGEGEVNEKDLYIDPEDGYKLKSENAFDDTYELTIHADKKAYIFKVTDAQTVVTIQFFGVDGTTPAEANLGNFNYIVANNNDAIEDVSPINISVSEATASLNVTTSTVITLIQWNGQGDPDPTVIHDKWWYDGEGKLVGKAELNVGSVFGAYKITEANNYYYKAVKQASYTVKIAYDGEINPSDFNNSYNVYAGLDIKNQEGKTVRYYSMQDVTLDGNEKTIDFTTFDRSNGNPNTYTYQSGDSVQVVLGKNLQIENNGDFRGTIASGTQFADGDVIANQYAVTYTPGADGVTITISKLEPYHYTIHTADNQPVALESENQNNWYILSTLTKPDGTEYYYVAPVQNWNGGDIPTFYRGDKSHSLSNMEIGNPSAGAAATSAFQDGDTVENVLVRTSSQATKYQAVIDGDRYDSGSVFDKYKVSINNPDTTGNADITLTRLPKLGLKTVFKDTEGEKIPSDQLPGDYYLLIKMTDAFGEKYVALQKVDQQNPSVVSANIMFKHLDGNTLSSETRAYSGVETVTTQLVIGNGLTLTADLANGRAANATYYNVNTADGSEGKDLSRDLYSSSSKIADEDGNKVLTTTFTKQPDNGQPHDINVTFYKKHKDTPADGEPVENAGLDTATNAYFFRVRLYKKGSDDLVAYAFVPVSADSVSAANDGGTFKQTIPADQTFQLADDQGADIPGGILHYDPTVYESDIRLYKANSAGDLPQNLQQVSSKGTDAIPGYDFWFNDEVKTDDVVTGHNIGLYQAHKKVYQLKIVIDNGGIIAATDSVDLTLKADHHSTGTDVFRVYSIPSTSSPGTYGGAKESTPTITTEDGKTVVTYIIEDQTGDVIDHYWTERGASEDITGNETFSIEITQDGNDLTAGLPAKLGNQFYDVSYDLGRVDGVNVVNDYDNNKTTITHFVYLKQAQYDSAIGPYDVLGEGAEYGVVANTYIRHDHTETNFAVNTYNEITSAGIDVDAAGEGQVPFYIGNMPNGMHFASTNTSDPDVYTPVSGKTQPYLHTAADESKDQIHQDSYAYPVTVMPKSKTAVSDYVSRLISKLQTSSAAYQNKPNQIKPSGDTVDTTMFPDNVTIYVDASDVNLATTGWKIKKLPGQSIVFNIPGDSVHISKEIVEIYDPNEPTTMLRSVDANTGGNGGNAAHNKDVENDILNHIVFNAFEARTLEVSSGPAGLFLAPKANAKVVENSGSGTGWIATAGTFDQVSSEWHFFRTQRRYSREDVKANFTATKYMKRGDEYQTPNKDQVFNFTMEHLDWDTGLWLTDYNFNQKNSGSSIKFPELSYSIAEEGTHYYRIRELYSEASAKYAPDQRQFFVKVDVTAKVTGDHDASSPSTGYSNVNQLNGYEISQTMTYYVLDPETNTRFNESTFYTNNDSQTVHVIRTVTMTDGSTQIEPLKTTTNVVRHGIDLNQLDKATTIKGAETTSSTDPSEAIVFVNSYIGKYCVAITKDWADENDRDGVRPDEIRVELWKQNADKTWSRVDNVRPNAEGNAKDYIVLNAANNWTAVVKGVDKFDESGNLNQYAWRETDMIFGTGANPIDVEAVFSNDSSTFTYYLKPDGTISEENGEGYIEIKYTNENGIRPLDTKTSDEDGGTVTYVTGMTNTHETVKTDVQATKQWIDDNNKYGLRKDITFRLIAEYTVDGKKYEVRNITDLAGHPVSDITIAKDASTQEERTAKWKNLPKYYDGNLITYKVLEVEVPAGYTSDAETAIPCAKNSEGVFAAQITNTLDTGALKICKSVFVDGEDKSTDYADKEFYVKIKVSIGEQIYWLANDNKLSASEDDANVFTVNPSEAKALEIENLPVGDYTVLEYADKDGKNLVGELNVPGDMGDMTFLADLSHTLDTATVSKNGTATAALINAYTAGRFCIAVTKQWQLPTHEAYADDSLEIAVRLERTTTPDKADSWVVVNKIYMGDKATVIGNTTNDNGQVTEYILLNKTNNWSAVAVGMDQMDQDGNRYTYRWVEGTVNAEGEFSIGAPEGWTAGDPAYEAIQGKTAMTFLTKLINIRDMGTLDVEKAVWVFPEDDEDAWNSQEAKPDYSTEKNWEQAIKNKSFQIAVYAEVTENDQKYHVYYAPNGAVLEKKKAEDQETVPSQWFTLERNAYDETAADKIAHHPLTWTLPVGTYFVQENGASVDVRGYKLHVNPVFIDAGEKTEAYTSAAITVKKDETAKAVINNGYERTHTKAAVTKVWADGAEPEKVTMRLYANNVPVLFTESTSVAASQLEVIVPTEGNETSETKSGFIQLPDGTKLPVSLTYQYQSHPYRAKDNETYDDAADTNKNYWTVTVSGLPEYLNGALQSYTWQEALPNDAQYAITNIRYGVIKDDKGNTVGYVTEITNGPKGSGETSIAVVKVWDDNNNQDGKRPESLVVNLLANDVATGKSVTLTEKNNWTGTINGLEADEEIKYTWSEANVPEGYTLSEPVTVGYVTTLTNKHTPETTQIDVKKVWEDANNQDGIRPASVTVYLLADGTPAAKTELNEANQWKHTFTDLPKYADGKAITYTIDELTVEGYEVKITGDAENGFTVTNTHAPEKTEVKVIKVWDDAENQDGKRPEELVVTLLADDKETGKTVTLKAADNWTGTIKELAKYANGEEIKYTWSEGTLPDGYMLTDTETIGNVTTLTNSYTPEVIQIQVTKKWDDQNDTDGLRPASVTVRLTADGTEVAVVSVNKTDGWTYTFKDLPKYADGKLINYELTEDGVAHYTTKAIATIAESAGENKYEIEITNEHKPEPTSAKVIKVWNDNNDAAGKRVKAEITVQLLANNEPLNEYSFKLPYQGEAENISYAEEGNVWTLTVNNLPQYVKGIYQTYSWIETIGSGSEYTMTNIEITADGTTITNTYETDRYCLEVLKVWNDDNDSAGFRPDDITVTLMKMVDGEPVAFGENELLDAEGKPMQTEYTLNEKNHWTAMATGLPKGEFEYVWVEDETKLGKYTAKTTTEGTITYLTNTYEPETVEVPVEKSWADNDNQDGIRPASVTVYLLADGTPAAKTELNDANEWKHTFTDLPKYADGKQITYTIDELTVEGYEVAITGDAEKGFTVTNTHAPEKTEVKVIKVWDDAENQDGKRPANLVVKLLADDKDTEKTVTLTAADNWTGTIQELAKYANGKEIKYTWSEETVPDGYTLKSNETEGYVTTVTNAHTPEITEIPVTKIWVDSNDIHKLRPESVTVQLIANGNPVQEKTLAKSDAKDDNTWSYTFTKLPKYANGKEIVYEVREINVPEWYTMSQQDKVITNTLNTGDLVITKTFSENVKDMDAVKDLTFTITGPEFNPPKTVTYAEDFKDGKYELKDVLVGRYTVVEENAVGLIANYTLDLADSQITGTADVTVDNSGKPASIELSNIYTEDKGALEIAKEWCFSPADAVNTDERKNLTVTIANSKGQYVKNEEGELTDEETKLTITDGRRLVIQNLPIDTYTVTETNADGLITGYSLNTATSTTRGSAATVNGAKVTVVLKNNYTRDTGSLELKKTWDMTGVTKVPEEVLNGLHFEITSTAKDFKKRDVYYAEFTKDGMSGTLTLQDLPVGEYTVIEMNADTVVASYGYDLVNSENGVETVQKNGTAKMALTNTYKQHRGLTIVKVFEGVPAGAKLDDLSFTIKGPNGYTKTVAYKDFVNGAYTIPAEENIPEGTYTVNETNAERLIASYTLDTNASVTSGTAEVKDGENAAAQVVLKNVYKPDQGVLIIRKIFRGTNGAALGNPTFTITGPNGYTNTVQYKDFNSGASHRIEGLTQGYYSVVETVNDQRVGDFVFNASASTTSAQSPVMTGYVSSVDIVNTYNEEKGSLTIRKTFNGQPEGANLNGLTFQITGPNGYSNTVSYASFVGGAYTIKNLALGAYTVRETNADTLIAGYTLHADSVTEGEFTLTSEAKSGTVALNNTYDEIKGKLTITKTFTGLNKTDNVDHLQFRILGPDGFEQREVSYGDFTDGVYTLEDIPLGQYAVYELNAGYLLPNLTLLESTTAGNALVSAEAAEQTIALTNNYKNSNTSVAVLKIWNDKDNVDGVRPESLTVNLSNGSGIVKTVTLNAENNWAAEVNDLPLYSGSTPITYTWTEQSVSGYTLSSQRKLGNATVLTNTHVPEVVSVTVAKIWDDKDNAAGQRPATLRVTLSNGANYTLSAANNWTVTVNDLPKYKNGDLINYTWSEQSVLGYTQTKVVTTGDVTYFTNTYNVVLPPPPTPGKPDTPKKPTIENHVTPLGIEVIINHVGDCFD